MDAQADLSLSQAHTSEVTVSHVASNIIFLKIFNHRLTYIERLNCFSYTNYNHRGEYYVFQNCNMILFI